MSCSSSTTAAPTAPPERSRSCSRACPVRRRGSFAPHRGKGAAVAAGLAELTTDYAGFCDLDLSTPLDHFERVVDTAMRRAGTRHRARATCRRRGSSNPESRLRETLGRAYNRLLQATLTPGVVDTQCGAKVAARSVWEPSFRTCHESGFAWDAELVAVAQAHGIEIVEVPVEWSHDDRSHVNVGRDGIAMVLATPRIWRRTRHVRLERRRIAPAASRTRRARCSTTRTRRG